MVHSPKTKKELKNLYRANTDFIYKNDLDKDATRRTQSDKVLRDKAFEIAKNPKYDGYHQGLASMVYKVFDKKSNGSGFATKPNYQLANELHRQFIRKFKRRKVHSSFRDNIWGVDLADM